MTAGAPTMGYRQVFVEPVVVVTREDLADDALALLRSGTLYEGAAHVPHARTYQGRAIAYAIALPVSGIPAVVRHNWHGGWLAPLTQDLFFSPTRAPYELMVSRQLRAADVRTPEVLMFGVSPRFARIQRADVVTREIEGGRDLATYMRREQPSASRAEAWAATRELVRSLNAAGARHHDLNVKNILLAPAERGLTAWVLDVDRVVFGQPGARGVREGNIARLQRSARKWRDERGAEVDESVLAALD